MGAIQQMLLAGGGYVNPNAAFMDPSLLHTNVNYEGVASTDVFVPLSTDLATNGGMIWAKNKQTAGLPTYLMDTDMGIGVDLNFASTGGTVAGGRLDSFTTTGVQVDGFGGSGMNEGNATHSMYAFRKHARFMQMGSYTGNGANRTIAHGLSGVPGMIIIKRTDAASVGFNVWMSPLTGTQSLYLDTTAAPTASGVFWNSTLPTSSVFSLGGYASVNATGGTYRWWAFANDSAPDGIVRTGSYVGNASASGPTVTLGWEPDLILIRSSGIEQWRLFDSANGLSTSVANDTHFYLNGTTAPQAAANFVDATATGFQIKSTNAGVNSNLITYYYMAIRKA